MKGKTSRLLIFILSLFFVVAFFGFLVSPAAAKDNMTVGFSMSLTGKYAPGAKGQMDSYLLWEEVVNKKGGILVKEYGKKLPVKLVYYDDKSETDTAVRVYEKLITEDKVDIVLSPYGTSIHFAVEVRPDSKATEPAAGKS